MEFFYSDVAGRMNADPTEARIRPARGSAVRPGIYIAGAFLVGISVLAVLAPILPLSSHLEGDLSEQFLSPDPMIRPSAALPGAEDSLSMKVRKALFGSIEIFNLMGTDSKGRDLCSRILWGGRVSLWVGLIAALISLIVGIGWGATAGYAGGTVDQVMMRIVDILYSIPFVVVVIYMISLIQEYEAVLRVLGIDRITVLYLLVGLIYWLTMARIVRGQVLSLRERDFVCAARALGATHLRIIVAHLVPNILGVAVVYLTLTIPRAMLFEAFISFVGLGVEPPDVSWGLLASDSVSVINPINIYWWLIIFPGGVLTLTLLSLNLLGDALRDRLDPRMEKKSS
ncbi:MAG: ABC transporter permease [Planctomycetota bacterium]